MGEGPLHGLQAGPLEEGLWTAADGGWQHEVRGGILTLAKQVNMRVSMLNVHV